jgi:anti-anti-sigma regulatory factor
MGIQFTREDNSLVASFIDELSIYTANEYRDALIVELPAVSDLTINLAGVTDLDSAGLQLLMALSYLAPDIEVQFVEHSSVVSETLDLLGLSGHFAAPVPSATETRL